MVRADPSLLGETEQPSAPSETSCNDASLLAAFYISANSTFFYFQVFLWMRHPRDWIWERLRLWRTFKGLQPSKTPTDCIRFEQQLFYLNPPATTPPWLLPRLYFQSPVYLSDISLVICLKFQIVNKQTVISEPGRVFLLLTDRRSDDENPTRETDWSKAARETSDQPRERSSNELSAEASMSFRSRVMSCYRNSVTTNFKFGLWDFFKVWIYGWGGWAITGKG